MKEGLSHVMVVAGTPEQWAATSAPAWDRLVDDLARAAGEAGAEWLTLRPYGSVDETAGGAAALRSRSRRVVGGPGCRVTVVVNPVADGRLAFTEAVARIEGHEPITEQEVAAGLYEPADADPDLLVIAGPSDRLPPSLMWELAYGEFVFVDTDWAALSGADVAAATEEFAARHRRFGGVG